jgi:hypothetical protein
MPPNLFSNTHSSNPQVQFRSFLCGNREAGNEDGSRFKGTRRRLDALRGGFGQRPKETHQQPPVSSISSQKVEDKS